MLPVLRRLGIDIRMRHQWTKEPLKLHLFKHKGYWYHGRRRESTTMLLFRELLRPGDFIVEIGGHIGYVSMYLASLVQPGGRVVVFEPAPDNLAYIRENTRRHPAVSVIDQAVTDHCGVARLYVEELTGQNNSLLSDYARLAENERWAYAESGKRVIEVECTSLDEFLERERAPAPSLVKVDVEGAELSVLQGMRSTLLEPRIALMVEVTERAADVLELLAASGYHVFRPDRSLVTRHETARGNLFCLKDTDSRIENFRRASTER